MPFPYFAHATYITIFIVLAFIGYFIPLPEEIILIAVGYSISVGFDSPLLVILVALAATVTGDNIIFWLSRRGHNFTLKLKSKLKPNTINRYDQMVHKRAGRTIFILRLIAGLRILSPMLAGLNRVPWQKFQLFEFLALIIYVPTMIFIGYHFHDKIAKVLIEVALLRHTIFVIILIIAGLLAVRHLRKKFYTANRINQKSNN